MGTTRRGMGWRPDTDRGGRRFSAGMMFAALPDNVDLSTYFPPCYDQGQLGSCTGNGIAAVVQYCRARERLPDFVPSRLFIYYGEREREGTTDSDAGAEIHDGIKVVMALGAPSEADWPYDVGKFAARPPPQVYVSALQDVVRSAARVDQTVDALRACVAAAWPVVFGIQLYESFEGSAVERTGLVPMPGSGEKVIGGHCMVVVGYDHPRRLFQVRNSWGTGWGDGGNCWLPYDYLTGDDASDFWQVDATSS